MGSLSVVLSVRLLASTGTVSSERLAALASRRRRAADAPAVAVAGNCLLASTSSSPHGTSQSGDSFGCSEPSEDAAGESRLPRSHLLERSPAGFALILGAWLGATAPI